MKAVEKIEEALVRREKYDSAEKIQSFLNGFTSSKEQRKWCSRVEKERLNGASISQREVYLTEEVEALEKSHKIQELTQEEQERLAALKEELHNIDGDWWLHRRGINGCEVDKPKGAHIRRWDTKAKNPQTEESRRRWCKARGGCCDYDCGCCTKVRNERRTKKEVSHCSPEDCVCCIRRRGSRAIPDYYKARVASTTTKTIGVLFQK